MSKERILTHGSLFSGIGGFDLAAEWAGFQNIFHADNNDFCRQVLEHQFPNSDSYADITTTDFSKYRNRITVLTGGFPCQPFSLAGKRKGAADDRYLWPAMLDIIRQVRPTWIIGENVIGIASMVLPGTVTKVEDETTYQEEDHRVMKPKNSDSSSTAFVKILSKRDIPSNRLLFRLAASVRPTNETGCGSLHDLMKQELLPTPVASDATMGAVIGKEDTFRITSTGMPRKVNRNGQDGSVGLARLVKLWDLLPTPTATDATRGGETVTGKSKQRANGLIFSATLSDLTVSGLLPTPVASDRNGGSTRTDPARQFSCALQDYVHGVAQQKDQSLIGRSSQLNPRFTLEMMGFPANWLDYPYHIKSGEPKP